MHRITAKSIITICAFLFTLNSCYKENPIDCTPFSFSDSYDYPLIPGSQEWIDLGSRDARAQASMIPQETLKTISTGGLFESLLNYPYILDYSAWDKMQNGFAKLKLENSGFNELYCRKDLFKIIPDCYSSLSPSCKEFIYYPFHNAPVSITMQITEFIIFQNEFLDSLSQDELKYVFRLVYNKHREKIYARYPEYDQIVSAAILGKIMYKREFRPFTNECNSNDFLKFFIEYVPDFRPVDLIPTDIIYKYAVDYNDHLH